MVRCHVHILDTYILKLVNGAKEKDVFYLKPRTITTEDLSAPWFIPVGRNSLGAMVKAMTSQEQLGKDVTNHSLRVYGVTKMFSAKVPEKIIMERSGHQSVEGV